MTNSARKATILVVNAGYSRLTLGPAIVAKFDLLAVDEDGVVYAETQIDPLNREYEDVDADFMSFIDASFERGEVTTFVANQMYPLQKYIDRRLGSVEARLDGVSHIDVDTLVEMLPQGLSLFHGAVPSVHDIASVYVYFKKKNANAKDVLEKNFV